MMAEQLTETCTCDDLCDSPCPRHKREIQLEKRIAELEEAGEELLKLMGPWDIRHDEALANFNRVLKGGE